jgi:AcrR family transcriptional regulator
MPEPARNPISARNDAFESRRLEILRSAALAFAEEGYHQTSVNSLGEQLGVSKPVLYYYAKNKDDLLFQCGEIARAELRQAIEEAAAAQMSGLGRIRRFFSAYAEIMCGEFGRCLALVDHRALNPETRAKDVAVRRALEAAVQDMLREGQDDGSIGRCDLVLTTRALFGAFNGIPRWFRRDGKLNAADVAESYLDTFVVGFGKR